MSRERNFLNFTVLIRYKQNQNMRKLDIYKYN